jgi:hypothetical protein
MFVKKSLEDKMFKKTLLVFNTLLLCISCSGANTGAETQFTNQTTEGTTVPLNIRRSTLLILTLKDGKIEDNRGTGTLVSHLGNTFVLTAGHVVMKKDQSHASEIVVCRMVGNFGFIYIDYAREIQKQTFCYPVTFQEGNLSDDKDFAVLSAPSVLSPLLVPAEMDLDPKIVPQDVLEAAGFGVGQGQGEFKDSPEEVLRQCKSVLEKDPEQAEIGGCLRDAKLKAASEFAANTTYWLRGGRMKVDTVGETVSPKEGAAFTQSVVLSVLKKNGAQASAGDSGMGWWKDGKLVGVHFAGNGTLGGNNSYFRLAAVLLKK